MPEASLQVRRTGLARWWWHPLPLLLLVAVGWWLTHMPPLSDQGGTVRASTRVGTSVYVGTWGPSAEDGPVHLSGVEVAAEGGDVTPQVCVGGRIGVTTDPAAFCESVEDAEDRVLEPGDQLVLAITGDSASTITIDPVEVSWREGLRGGSQRVGPRVSVDVAG